MSLAARKPSVFYLYIFEISTRHGDLSEYLLGFNIDKNFSQNYFATDYFTFDSRISSDLMSMTNEDLHLRIYKIGADDTLKLIYENDYVIADVSSPNVDYVMVYVESKRKIVWTRRATHSVIIDNSTCNDAIKKYVDLIDNKFKYKTEIYFSNTINLNKHKYEKILFPLQEHYKNIAQIASKYFILNAPFYMYFDEYNFGSMYKQYNWFRIGFYDYTEPTHLKANSVIDQNKSAHAYGGAKVTEYYTLKNVQVEQDYIQREGWFREPNSYIPKKMHQYKVYDSNKVPKYTPDSIKNALKRQQIIKTFYDNLPIAASITINDFDIENLSIGNRLLIDTSAIKTQYMYNIIEIEYMFTRVDTFTSEKRHKTYDNVFRVSANIDCILITKG